MVPDKYRDPKKQPRCNICGRACRKVTWPDPERNDEERFIRWQCVKVSSDGEGGWDHD
jgi:hypothetical protein